MINVLFKRLILKEKPFHTQDPTADAEMDSLWNEILKVDSILLKTDTTAPKVNKKTVFMELMRTHCFERNYVFAGEKCGSRLCNICNPPRLPEDVFSGLHFLPDPMPKDDHYLPFQEVYGKVTEKFRPSLSSGTEKDQAIPLSSTAQTAKNVKETIECEECSKKRSCIQKRN